MSEDCDMQGKAGKDFRLGWQGYNHPCCIVQVYPFESPGAASGGTVVDGHDMRGPPGMLEALQLQS